MLFSVSPTFNLAVVASMLVSLLKVLSISAATFLVWGVIESISETDPGFSFDFEEAEVPAFSPKPVNLLSPQVYKAFASAPSMLDRKRPVPPGNYTTPSELGIEVLGLAYNTEKAKSSAIVVLSDGKQKLVRGGDELGLGFTLVGILPNALLLQRGEEDFIVTISEGFQSNQRSVVSTVPTRFPRELVVSKSFRSRILSAPSKLSSYLNFSPVLGSEGLRGYAISPGVNASAFERSGFEAGDVVSHINDVHVAELNIASLLQSDLIDANRVNVTVERSGVIRKLELIIK